MTTPAGLLRWGQSGRYSAREDRQVITALAGRRAGIVTPVRLSPALGLGIAVDPGWLAIAACGDGTVAVLTSDDGAEVQAAQGGAEARVVPPSPGSRLPRGGPGSWRTDGHDRRPPEMTTIVDILPGGSPEAGTPPSQ